MSMAAATAELVRAATAVDRQLSAMAAQGPTRSRLLQVDAALVWLKQARDAVMMAAAADPRWSA